MIDLQDAYFHVSIHLSHSKYLRFQFNKTIYQFCSLPFGLSTAPRTFTKCMAPVAAHPQLQGINIYSYIDDWLIVATSYHNAVRATNITLNALQRLGLKVNYTKSHLKPAESLILEPSSAPCKLGLLSLKNELQN